MKPTFATVITSLACVAAFGQGRVRFENDSLHLVCYDSTMGVFAGQAVYSGNMPSGFTFVADLYMGTSSSLLSLYATTTFGATPGEWNPDNVTTSSPFIGIGTTVFTVVQVRDILSTPSSTWTPLTSGLGLFGPFGYSQQFTFLLGGPLTFPSLVGPNSTWPPGTVPMDAYGVGSRCAIPVGYIPEPSTVALSAFGLFAGCLARRMRKLVAG